MDFRKLHQNWKKPKHKKAKLEEIKLREPNPVNAVIQARRKQISKNII